MEQIVTGLKYLGVIIEDHKSWNKHIDYLTNKIKKLYHAVMRMTSKEYGLSGKVIKAIYIAAIEPILCYDSSSWVNALNWVTIRRKLLSAQRNFALAIIKGYRTISTEATTILAGLAPIDLKIEFCARRYLLKKQDKILCDINFLRPINFFQREHPSLSTEFSSCKGKHLTEIFTDGSKINEQTGCAFVVYANSIELHSEKYRLDDRCSVYQAELLAILKAVEWCAKHKEKARIYSDSMSSIQSIQKKNNNNSIVNEIRKALRSTEHVCLKWIKAHVGNFGNEEADERAKEATCLSNITFLQPPISHGIKILKDEMINKWNERWINSEKGRVTAEFFPTVKARLNCSHIPDYQTTQFMSNHGFFKSYLKRFRIISEGKCTCGDEQDAKHLLMNRPSLILERMNAERDVGHQLLPSLINNKNFNQYSKFMHIAYRVRRHD